MDRLLLGFVPQPNLRARCRRLQLRRGLRCACGGRQRACRRRVCRERRGCSGWRVAPVLA